MHRPLFLYWKSFSMSTNKQSSYHKPCLSNLQSNLLLQGCHLSVLYSLQGGENKNQMTSFPMMHFHFDLNLTGNKALDILLSVHTYLHRLPLHRDSTLQAQSAMQWHICLANCIPQMLDSMGDILQKHRMETLLDYKYLHMGCFQHQHENFSIYQLKDEKTMQDMLVLFVLLLHQLVFNSPQQPSLFVMTISFTKYSFCRFTCHQEGFACPSCVWVHDLCNI